ncbi:MAG TPA: EAL domain-containing protein [Telluria sp.]|nr:EAL domain-containing protein [Telluria sp.]
MKPVPPVAVFVVDQAGLVTSWDRACAKLSGLGPQGVVGLPLGQVLSFDDADDPLPQSRAGREEEMSAHLAGADGVSLPVRVLIVANSPPGQPSASYSVIMRPRVAAGPARYELTQDLPVSEILESLPCVFYVIDERNHLMLWNHQLEDALEMDSAEMPAHDVALFFDEQARAMVIENIRRAFTEGTSSHEADMIGKRGKRATYLFHCARTTIAGQSCVFGTGLDISRRKSAEQVLRVRERAIFSSVNAIVITCCEGTDNRIEYVNPAFEQLTGYTLAEVKGRDPRFMRHPEWDVEEHRRIRDALRRTESVQAVVCNVKKNGETFWNELRIDPVVNVDGKVTHFVAVINDITNARQYERRLQHLAQHDPLTGLANRSLLQEHLRLAVDTAVRQRQLGALAFLDLDNFKHINDSLGHATGDIVLCEIASRLRENVREQDIVARVGGDEFVLVLTDQSSVEHVADTMERIRRSLGAPIKAGGDEITAATSIGVSLFPRDGNKAERVIRAADTAMYHAKSLGKNNCQFYSEDLNQVVQRYMMLEASLSRAIQNGELALGYQPKVDLRTGAVVGAEALVRWHHADGVIAPDQFIPVAEQTGLIVPLGEWVIGEACAALRALREEGMSELSISVNLSARQLRQRHFARRLAETLERHCVSPYNLELEVTESQLMDHPEQALEVLAQLKQLGVRMSIDDFGTGYSSLSHLQKFPVDSIKIDRSFLAGMEKDGHAVITRTIIALGHNLKLKVIAEGVETRAQLSFLREHDCDQMQGYYFSAAVSRAALAEMVCRDVRLAD